jgi:hypothetical protein
MASIDPAIFWVGSAQSLLIIHDVLIIVKSNSEAIDIVYESVKHKIKYCKDKNNNLQLFMNINDRENK